MPRRSSKRHATGTFSDTSGAREFVLANHATLSLTDLSERSGVAYSSVAAFLAARGLAANRYSRKRFNLLPLLSLSQLELSYLAGIIDGEETISYGKRWK